MRMERFNLNCARTDNGGVEIGVPCRLLSRHGSKFFEFCSTRPRIFADQSETPAYFYAAFRSRHVSPAVTCWTMHVNLIETFRQLAAYVYTRKMCYSRNASTKVPGNRKVNRFLSRRCARTRGLCVCVYVCATRNTTRGETSNYLDSEWENALCKMARRKEASLDWPIMTCN